MIKEVYANIVQNLNDESSALQVVQKLLTNNVGERDISAQETCHLLLQLPLGQMHKRLYHTQGSCQVQESESRDSTTATVASVLDHYIE